MSRSAADGPTGLLVVDKPAGLTSHDVVARVRRVLGTRKVGHAGTLDPMATGLLLLGVGRATRLLGHLALAEKTYDATVRLGASTTTDDAEGEVLATASTVGLTETAVRDALGSLVGELDQVPSAVSAVKVGGTRAHARVRAGEQVELAPRRVTVHDLVVHDVRRPAASGAEADEGVEVDLTVRCSSGTYVRAIARDLGAALGVGGHLSALRRTVIGPPGHGITLAEAVALEDLDGGRPLLGMGEVAARFLPAVTVDADDAAAVSHGRRLHLRPEPADAPVVAVLTGDRTLLGLYRPADPREDGSHAPLAVLC